MRRGLEDELIRALGVPAVERLLAVQGELESFRRRKVRYGALLTNALDLRCVPRALDAVIEHARH